MNNIIRLNIKKILRSQGREQQDLYEALSISKQAFHARVSGNVTLNNLKQIADALGCRVVDLLIEPREQIVSTERVEKEPVITNLIECPECGTKLYVHAIKDLK